MKHGSWSIWKITNQWLAVAVSKLESFKLQKYD